MNHPTGTVSFLFTDIEGSTKLWEQHPAAMQTALARHDALLRRVSEAHQGYVFKTVGDAFCVAFTDSDSALHAALESQQALFAEPWGEAVIKVRMALHCGEAESRDNDYFGPPLNRVARLLSAGHGGQVLLSTAIKEQIADRLPENVALRDMGQRRLKDLIRPEHIYQVIVPGLPIDFPPLKTLDRLHTNLPAQLTSFVGRGKEIIQLKQLLTEQRLTTLVGPGGTGKTRLSLQVAADLLDTFLDGVWFIELAPLADPALIAQTIVTALDLREEAGRPALAIITDYLRAKKALLILDNCEHLIETCAQLAETLLKACPQLHIVASSREALGIAGESAFRVPSLPAPNLRDLPSSETLAQYEAVKLFVDRAVTALPDFALTRENVTAIAQICARLDGIPLAIELAAARVKMLKVEQIAARLDDRFRLLTGGSRTALERHQTLRALIDWSYDLLSMPERVLLRRLAVFAGGWTLEAAEAVCVDRAKSDLRVSLYDVLDLLTQLVNKSLIIADQEQGRETRYRMLDTIRQYAREKLLDSGEVASLRDQHLEYLIGLARRADPKLRGPEQTAWLERLKAEIDNIRAALEWSLDSGQVVKGLELTGELDRFWHFYNSLEDRRWLEAALQHPSGQERTPIRAKALYVAAFASGSEGRYATAGAYANESAEIWRELGDQRGLAYALGSLGFHRGILDDISLARSLVTKSIALFREIGDRWGLALSLRYLGNWSSEDGSYIVAHASLMESLALFQEMGDWQATGMPLYGLGDIAAQQGNYQAARHWLEKALAVRQEAGEMWGAAFVQRALGWVSRLEKDYPSAAVHLRASLAIGKQLGNYRLISEALHEMAEVVAQQNQLERAVRLFGAAAQLMKITGGEIEAQSEDEYESSIEVVRTQLGEATFDAAWSAGNTMTPEQAVAYALEETP